MHDPANSGAAKRATRAAVFVALLSAAPPVAVADVLIVSSDVAVLKAGTQLADSDRLDLPAGAKVRVLLPSGKTQVLSGPVSGFVRDISKGERLVDSVWSKAKDLLETGGVEQSKVGAVRSFSVAKPAETTFTWNVIPAAINGSVCVERNAKLLFERPPGDKSKDLTIIETLNSSKVSVPLAEGATTVDWPSNLTVKPGASYQIVPSAGRLQQITLHLIEKSMTEETVALQALLELGCDRQARAWLRR
jgi:hypothetical protein